jgi:hypothetical protein
MARQPENQVKDELSCLVVGTAQARRAEVAAMLRLGGGLAIMGNTVVVDAELDHLRSAQRLASAVYALYGATPVLHAMRNSTRGGERYILRVTTAERLARQTGLIDHRGRPINGLPPWIIRGSRDEIEGAWRGAVLATGRLALTGQRQGLTVYSPSPEAALALVGLARRLGVSAQRREDHGRDWVVVRGDAPVTTLLTHIGAAQTSTQWSNRRDQRLASQTGTARSPTFESANTRRAAAAAAESTARVQRAMQILGDTAPEHLASAAALRLANPGLALSDLGGRADPPMTKDAVAGRIRRLLDLADRTAHKAGIADTTDSVAG